MLTTKLVRSQCPACLGDAAELKSIAVISPWVAELLGESRTELTNYLTCSRCGTGWFAHSYSEYVFKTLYEDYRGANYFRIRNSWEPTYTQALNSELTSGSSWLDARKKQILIDLQNSGVDYSDIESVLDFGGGHGGVIPDFPKKYLIDSNQNIPTKPGITILRSLEEALEMKLDFVMCCGVLEHVNDPQELLTNILKLDCDLYLFEVPAGVPKHRVNFFQSAYTSYLSRRKLLWKLVQILERKLPFEIRHKFPLRCSEHLQFFSEKGFESLLSRSGFEVLFLGRMDPNRNLQDARNLGFNASLTVVCRRDNKH